MSAIQTIRDAIYGNPPSANFKPSREGVIKAFEEFQAQIDGVTIGIKSYATAAELPTNPAPVGGTMARVYDDTDPDKNTYWIYRDGAWSVDADLIGSIAAIVAPLIDRLDDLTDIVVAESARLYDQRPTFGELVPRATIQSVPLAGAQAITRGLRFTNGNGAGSFFSISAQLSDAERELIPVGAVIRVRAEFTVTAGAEAKIGKFSTGFKTQVVRTTDGLGVNHDEGAYDALASGYKSPTRLVRESTLTWYNTYDDGGVTKPTNIKFVGFLAQFSDVVPGYTGVVDVVLTSFNIVVDSVPASAYPSAADLVNAVAARQARDGYVISYTVGQQAGVDFGNLAIAEAALKEASPRARQRLFFLPGLDFNGITLPDNTDLIGSGINRCFQRYIGPAVNKQSWTPDDDNILTRGSNDIFDMNMTTENSNYVWHSESAGQYQDFLQRLRNSRLRHNGNEGVYQAGVAAGQANPAIRWTPCVGIGGSSGGRIEIERCHLTALKGGGVYVHNTVNQRRPFSLLVQDTLLGADDQIGADLFISTLASRQQDRVEMRGLTLSSGSMGAGFSRLDDDPFYAGAFQMDFYVFGEQVGNHVWANGFPGRALRARLNAPGTASIVGEGAAFEALFGAYPHFPTLIIGEPGRKAAQIGWFDVNGYSMGSRLGDCSSASKSMTFNASGAVITHTFTQDMRNVSNAAILAQINATFGSAATFDLYDPNHDYEPSIFDQEHYSTNNGNFAIHPHTLVVLTRQGGFCRCAEPDDFNGDGSVKNAGTVFGVAMEDIRIGGSGRVRVSGWVSYNIMRTNQIMPDVTDPIAGIDPAVGGGFDAYVNADGIHGVLRWKGNPGGACKVVRGYLADGQGRAVSRALQVG